MGNIQLLRNVGNTFTLVHCYNCPYLLKIAVDSFASKRHDGLWLFIMFILSIFDWNREMYFGRQLAFGPFVEQKKINKTS